MMTVHEPQRRISPNRSPFDKGQLSVWNELGRVRASESCGLCARPVGATVKKYVLLWEW